MPEKTKKRRRGRGCLWLFLVAALLVCCIGSMPVLNICPPDGPWPTPPWCVSELNCVDYPPTIIDDIIRVITDRVGAQNLLVANGCMFMRSIGDNEYQPYVYQALDYLSGSETYTPVEREITFSAGIADFWGNPYIIPEGLKENIPDFAEDLWYKYVDLGGNPAKHNNVENTTQRVAAIGAENIFVIDFIMLMDEDFTLERGDQTGTESLTQEDLDRIAQAAHDNGLEATLQLTLLDKAFADQIADYFNSGAYGSLWDEEGDAQTMFNRFDAGEVTATLHERWRPAIVEEARMAQAAGFENLVITPQYGWTNRGEYVPLDDAEWKETIAAVRQVFTGKVGGGVYDLTGGPMDERYTYYQDFDFVFLDMQVEYIGRGHAPDDLEGLTAAWKEHLLSPAVAQFTGVEQVWQGLMVNSYDGVLENGWIDSGGHYPDLVRDDRVQAVVYEAFLRALYDTSETSVNGVMTPGYEWIDFIYPNTHEIRNDLSISIRGKDAEHIFHHWTTIFK